MFTYFITVRRENQWFVCKREWIYSDNGRKVCTPTNQSRKDGEGVMAQKKQTSKAVATKASQILKDGRYGRKVKSVAGSALSQTRPGMKK